MTEANPKGAPYWTYWISVVVALIGALQVLGLAWIGSKIDTNTVAIVEMEHQINSNMERQIRQAIAEALAIERLDVLEKKTKE